MPLTFEGLPPRIAGLGELAANLWWSWQPVGRVLFQMLDRRLWREMGHNPVLMLRTTPAHLMEKAAKDPRFLRYYDVAMAMFSADTESKGGWFAETFGSPNPLRVAYFSAEYGLHHSLPFYAGGLGFLAGDHLKECSNLGVPLVGVGFMYPEGYLHQHIRNDGWQENLVQTLDRGAASITRVVEDGGKPVIVRIPLMDPPVYVTVWRVRVGRVDLYLLDTDIPQNEPWNRGISARLYTGDVEQRLRQELVLGIGGQEVLDMLGIDCPVLHLNEGHPAFALLERLRDKVHSGLSFERAAEEVRARSVFTTHTPVPAGHDVFPYPLMEQYFSSFWPQLGIDRDSFLKLGMHPSAPDAGFNMTAFSLRMCDYRNGVSRKHGEVARRMWNVLWPDRREEEVPIDSITNGVHVPTWIAPRLRQLFVEYVGPRWIEGHDNPVLWELVDDIPDQRLWEEHCYLKERLINLVRERARQRWAVDRVDPTHVVSSGALLDPSALTIGFARRFATYKRADLLLRDIDRLKRLVNDPWRPVQFIFAGKAHPADDPGKAIIQRIFRVAQDPELGGRIAFVEDYGEQLAKYLVQGVDVWLNNPLPPLEASGTSGMKAAINGVPNFSELDGWWIEGYDGQNGWAFGDENGDRDAADATTMYRILEEEIVPLFYRYSNAGLPQDWIKVMKQSIRSSMPRFCSRRMVKEYTTKFYLPAAGAVEPGHVR